MSSCYKTSNNKYAKCPPRMDDGRHFTDYRPNHEINKHIIENNKIGIYNLTKGIGSLVSGNIQPEYLQIKSIEYRYPDSQTKLEVGEFLYDSFDLENSLVEDVRSTQSNQF